MSHGPSECEPADGELPPRRWSPEEVDAFLHQARMSLYPMPARAGRGWIGLMTRGLPPLPEEPAPQADRDARFRRFYLLPVLLLIAFLVLLVGVISLVPNLLLSPVTGVAAAAGGDGGVAAVSPIISLTITTLLVVALVWLRPRGLFQVLFDAAMSEELLFRYGCESWTKGQRARSCVQFGFAHLLNLVVAVATLGGLALVGWVFMRVYLWELRRTGSREQAVQSAAYFHAVYNVAAVVLVLLGGTIVLVSFFT